MLTGKQRSYLKKLGHSLSPIVLVGRDGLTENVMGEMDVCLENRELIKVKLQEGCTLESKAAANQAAEMLQAEFVQAIGRKFVLYRESRKDDLKERIVLPR